MLTIKQIELKIKQTQNKIANVTKQIQLEKTNLQSLKVELKEKGKSTEKPYTKAIQKKTSKTLYSSSSSASLTSPFDGLPPEKKVKGTSSRKFVILGIITVVIFIIIVIINKDKIFGGKDKLIVENSKKIENITDKKEGKQDIKKNVVPTENYRIHIVVKGDKLIHIAHKYLGKANRYPEIMKLNNMKKASDGELGEKLKIPNK